ncbi:MAG TPA: type II secretion system F family protein [Pirellulales bacterium]|jgi:tight adherence protein B|nr:type II secretion system F family protein [Pirellulales bacterium]
MSPLLISIAAFGAVAALVGAASMFYRGESDTKVEDRLAVLTSAKGAKGDPLVTQSVLSQPLDATAGIFVALLERFGRTRMLFEQADTTLTPSRFLTISGCMALGGFGITAFAGPLLAVAPLGGIAFGALPLLWLMWRRKRRLKKFGAQMPDALELISRALRSGHSLAAGFDLVQTELLPPISTEFGRVFEEQNLGIPLEEALDSMTNRVPNLDVKFFSTAVILQRQTGGDLAEILDKIGYLVRERFKIYGQIAALTGEGRLSGIVLLALPPVLFLVVYRMNPGYISLLFTDPAGKKMLAGAIVMQLLGALLIRKIINIKV